MNVFDAHAAAWVVADVLFSDSHVPVAESFPGLLKAVLEDGRAPTLEETVLLVEGDDLGEVPEELAARYPALHDAIGVFF